MPKIVTSEGVVDFVATGKPTEVIESDQAKAQAAKKAALNAKLAATDAPIIEAAPPPAPPPEEAPKAAEAAKESPKEPSDLDLDDDEKKLAKDIQKKIFKQIAKRKEAQSEAATAREEAAEAERFAEQQFNERQLWQRRAEEAERKAASAPAKAAEPAKEAVPPNPEDKKYYDAENKFKVWEYSADLAKHASEQAIAKDRKEQQEALAKQQLEADAARFRDRIGKAETKYDGKWKTTIDASDVTLPDAALQYLAQSDTGTDVAYYLALPENRKEAERIKGLKPVLAIAALRDIETGLTKPAAPPAPAAAPKEAEPVRSVPAPITPISTSGNGSVTMDPAKMSFKELRAYEREQTRLKGRR